MIKMRAVGVIIAFCSAMLLLEKEAMARSGGGGPAAHPIQSALGNQALSHRRGAFRPRNHNGRDGWPAYGSAGTSLDYVSDYVGATPFQTLVPPTPPFALSCQHSEETKTVPSEDGGTREIKITRC